MNPIVVQKYGGSSLADLDRVRSVAARIVETVRSGKRVVAVVSAMGDTTNDLLSKATGLSQNPNPRELDMLLSVGERISTALLAIAIGDLGEPAVSFTGSQSGIITNTRHNRARIIEVRPFRLLDELDAGKVVIVAGYQGVSYAREITTLGRGGTDTTAVALAAALEAEHCEICSDVDGIYTADPRVVTDARRLDTLSPEEMVALARSGARVLQRDCVEYAALHGVALFAKAAFGPRDDKGTVVRLHPRQERSSITAIAHRESVVEVTLRDTDRLSALLEEMSAHGAYASHIDGGHEGATRVLFDTDDTHRLDALCAHLEKTFGDDLGVRTDRGTVTVVGYGLGEDPTLVRRALNVAEEELGEAPSTRLDPLSLDLVVPSDRVADLARALHAALLEP
ncbi:MAG: aspartate kinase [Myxococcota bacterium]|nr:aspartate kinase [Myxococcota bacterium]